MYKCTRWQFHTIIQAIIQNSFKRKLVLICFNKDLKIAW